MISTSKVDKVPQGLPFSVFATLDGNHPIPIYVQIADCIDRAVERGDLVPGRIESEAVLAQRIGRSIQSVARAFRLLIDRGILGRIVGVGTFVIERRTHSRY